MTTTQTKHTPGPWTQIDPHVVRYSKGVICKTLDSNLGYEERLANARLIAAAPELLEALKLASEIQENGLVDFEKHGIKEDKDILKIFKAAISKAEGQS